MESEKIDEDFEFFLEKFGEPTQKIEATKQQIEAYRKVLPDKLLHYWQYVGFSGFKEGLFWITNPAEFDGIIEEFLAGTEFENYDNYHVIGRSAYGTLYLWGERTGDSLEIIPHLNWIKTKQGEEEEIKNGNPNRAIQNFFAVQKPKSVDIKVQSKLLFPKVVKHHGIVGKDEVMVFTPYLFMGGEKSPEKMAKENLHIFLQIISDINQPEIVDMASMVGNVRKEFGE